MSWFYILFKRNFSKLAYISTLKDQCIDNEKIPVKYFAWINRFHIKARYSSGPSTYMLSCQSKYLRFWRIGHVFLNKNNSDRALRVRYKMGCRNSVLRSLYESWYYEKKLCSHVLLHWLLGGVPTSDCQLHLPITTSKNLEMTVQKCSFLILQFYPNCMSMTLRKIRNLMQIFGISVQ